MLLFQPSSQELMKNILLFILAVLAIGLWSCEEEEHNALFNAEAVTAGTRVKFYHGIPGGPAVDLLWQGQRINGGRVTNATSPFLPVTYSNFFPALNNEYAVLKSGTGNLVVEIPDNPKANPVTTKTAVLTAEANLENDKRYTFAVYGTAAAPKFKLFNDDLPVRTSNLSYIRIIHLLNGGPAVDFGFAGAAALGSNIAEGNASAWASFPITETNGVTRQKISIRTAGSSTALLTSVDIDFQVGRCVTIVVRGTQGGTGTAVPALSTLINRF
jgi:hypothetical protein